MKRVCVLSGGELKGCYQVGVLNGLKDRAKFDFDSYYGTSVGALNSAFMGSFSNPRLLKDLWFNLKKRSDIIKPNFGSIVFSNAHFDTGPLAKLIDEVVVKNPLKPAHVSFVNYSTGLVQYASNQDSLKLFKTAVLASSSIPVIMDGVKEGENLYYDGGIIDMAPLERAVENEKADEYWVILTRPLTPPLVKLPSWGVGGTLEVLLRVVDLFTQTVMLSDIDYCKKVLGAKVHIIAPSNHLNADLLNFDAKDVRQGYSLGYGDAIDYLNEHEILV